ncbi:hypothetical protein B0H13DRAFT_2359232 [Mycena leptocephala]|nr:hypothetical protein B0H13DRAFT_2359232 [Mycena leptocephala]
MVQVPGIYWRADPYSAASVETLRWAMVACALLFFAFFAFADEAIKNYRGAFNSMAKCMRYTTAGSSRLSSTGCSKFRPMSSSSSQGTTLPVFIRKDTTQKRYLFDSFSDMSASYGGISPLEYDAEKAQTLGDVSGMSPDYKESGYSSFPSSASSAPSDTESIHSAGEEIEVSPLRCASVHIPPTTTLTPPEPAHTHVRRASADVPMPDMDAADIV